MALSISRHGGAASQVANSSPSNVSAGSLLSVHANRSSQKFEQVGNSPAQSTDSASPQLSPQEGHERQLGQEVNHVRSTTPTQGNPLLAGSLGSGSLMGSFVSTPL
jgi:hypothetical protein